MCGICGFTKFNKTVEDADNILKAMSDTLISRGPDEEGFYLTDNMCMGIRRLKVIDLVTGSQPIYNEKKDLCIVYNGEIYNFKELRCQLEKNGHSFYTASDTEVIIHLYEDFGEDCVKKINGMFAFAIYDEKKQKLFLARDRIGIKPLYYAKIDNELIFASELKAIFKYPYFKKSIDYNSLVQYLLSGYISAPNVIFAGIKKLMPGYSMSFSNGSGKNCYGDVVTNKYWDIRYDDSEHKVRTENEYAEKLLYELKNSVKRMLISDVPVGAFLSGGIDSSSIVAFMSQLIPGKVKTFSIGFEEKTFNELDSANKVAKIFGTEHYSEVFSDAKMLQTMPQVIDFLDEPLADPSIIPTFLLSKFTRKEVTVALSGDGGDELFAGYPVYQAHRLAKYYKKIPKNIRENVIKKMIYNMPVSLNNNSLDYRLKRFVASVDYPMFIRHFIWKGGFLPEEIPYLFTEDVKKNITQTDFFMPTVEIEDKIDPLEQLLYFDLKSYLSDDILMKVDRASMACSLEVRPPFLDDTFVGFVAKIPFKLKLHNFTTKYILKKSMQKFLPNDIIRQNKKGFNVPIGKWLNKEFKTLVLDVLSENRLKKQKIFKPDVVKQLLDEHFAGKVDNRKRLWSLLIFEWWLEKWGM